jgi:hypothetical protein
MRDDVRGLHMCCGHNCKTLYQFVDLPFSNFLPCFCTVVKHVWIEGEKGRGLERGGGGLW